MNDSKCKIIAILAAVMMTGSLAISASAANPESIDGDVAMEVRIDEADVDVPDFALDVFEAELALFDATDPESIDSVFAAEACLDEAGDDMSDSDFSIFEAELDDPASVAETAAN